MKYKGILVTPAKEFFKKLKREKTLVMIHLILEDVWLFTPYQESR